MQIQVQEQKPAIGHAGSGNMKNLLEFQNQFFQHAVNKVINSLESDNYNIDLSKYDQAEVKIGLEKEKEHTDDPKELSKIVADHLDEDPAYYSKMEKAGFDDMAGMLQKNIKSEIDEGRSTRRWTHSLAKEIKSYMISLIKNDIVELLKERVLVYNKNIFFSKFKQYPIMRYFGDVYIVARDDKKFSNGGGSYYYKPGSLSVENQEYSLSRGDFVFFIDAPRKLQNFEEIKDIFQQYANDITETISHEIKHFIDDFTGEGLEAIPSQDLFYKMPKHYIKKYNYYMDDDEVSAYVEAAMKRTKMQRIPFIKALYDSVIKERVVHDFANSINLRKIKYIIMYKYLNHAIKKYNSVMDDPAANKYFAKIEKFIIDNQLEKYVKSKEDTKKADRVKEKEKRRQEWEKLYGDSEPLKEAKSKLSKYWHKRAKSRAKRAGRHFPNNQDKEWAAEQEEKSKDLGSTLKKAFERDIKESEDFLKTISEIISKKKIKDPFLDAPTGRMKGFKSKHRGSIKIAPGERFGPIDEEG